MLGSISIPDYSGAGHPRKHGKSRDRAPRVPLAETLAVATSDLSKDDVRRPPECRRCRRRVIIMQSTSGSSPKGLMP